MSFNRIGLIIIAAGLIILIGTATRQMRQDQEAENAESAQLAIEKAEKERLLAEKLAKEQQTNAQLVREKLEQGQKLAEKLTQDRQAVERWEAAAAIARQSKPEVQVQTMIDPQHMVLVSTGKKKNRLTPKNAKTLVQQMRDQLGEGAAVKILDATGKEIARSE